MAKFVFIISGENEKLAFYELSILLGCSVKQFGSRFGMADTDLATAKNATKRAAYVNSAYMVLFETKSDELNQHISKFNWKKTYKQSFVVRVIDSDHQIPTYSEKLLAGQIWHALSNQLGIMPKVDLECAKTKIYFIAIGKIIYCCKLIAKNENPFEQRKPNLRPGFSPVSLHPRLARCMVNLTGCKKESKILDPFCGTGGLLIEAGLIGCKIKGSDLDLEMIERCKLNLKFCGVYQQGCLAVKNALEIGTCDCVVSDLPYGRNSRGDKDLLKVYDAFLSVLERKLQKCAVLSFPDNLEKKIKFRGRKLQVIAKFDYYIHKSLTKKIFVIERKK